MSQQQNKYLNSLYSGMTERFSLDSINMTASEWLYKNTKLDRKAYTQIRYPFQTQILDDQSKSLCCIKPSQVGLTELQIRKALAFLSRNQGTNLIYTLPNEDMFKRISDTRIKTVINQNKVFNPPTEIKPTRSQGLMQIGRSYLYIVAAIESAATSIDADSVFIDEIDLSNQQMLALMNSRMQNSDWKIKQSFSTPTYPAFGIDAQYAVSDQHVYMRKCGSCGHYNEPQFNRKFVHIGGLPDTIEDLTDIEAAHKPLLDLHDCHVHCERCRTPLDLSDHEHSQWVAKFPDRKHDRGYRVSPFSTHRIPVDYIINQLIDYKSKEFTRGCFNTVLGLPYSDGNIQIAPELIERAFRDAMPHVEDVGSDVPVWIGIDVGQVCNIVAAVGTDKNNLRPFLWQAMNVRDLIPFVKDFQKKYNLVGGCIDREPYEPTAREVMEITHGRIIAGEYGGRATKVVKDQFGDVTHAMLARTPVLDFVHTRMKRTDITFDGYGNDKSIISLHLRDMVREEQPEKPTIWKKLTNNDHYFHALAYLLVAPELRELRDHVDKTDKRTSVIFGGATIKDKSNLDSLHGMTKSSKSKLDKIVTTRVFN